MLPRNVGNPEIGLVSYTPSPRHDSDVPEPSSRSRQRQPDSELQPRGVRGDADADGARLTERGKTLGRLKTIGERLKNGAQLVTALAYDHGFGIAQTTLALHPFRTVVSSAKPKLASTVLKEGEPTPRIPDALARTAAMERPQAAEGPVLSALKDPGSSDLAIEKHYGAAFVDQRQALKVLVDRLKQDCDLSNSEAALLVKAMARSFRDADVARRMLEALTAVDLIGHLLDPPRDASADTQFAWKFAAEAERIKGGVGLDLLSKLTSRPAPASDGRRPPAMTDAQRGAVRAYLRAVSEVARVAGASGRRAPALDPGTIYSHGNVRAAIDAATTWPGRAGAPTPTSVQLSLAEKALLAVRDELDPSITQIHGCRFAVQMLRGDMPTDAMHDSNGRKTEFMLVESRAAKTMGVHLDRAIGHPNHGVVRDAIERQVAHHSKSPFFAYDAVVSKVGQNVGFGLAHRGGIHEGRALHDMIDLLEGALVRRGGVQGSALPNSSNPIDAKSLLTDIDADGDALRNMVRKAILQTAKAEALFLPRLARADALLGGGLDKARDAVFAMIKPSIAVSEKAQVSQAELAAYVESALDEENRHLTPERLLAWSGDIGGPADDQDIAVYAGVAAMPGQPDWQSFAKAFSRTANGDVPVVANLPIRNRSRVEVAMLLAEMIGGEELGSGFSFSNVGSTHVTTKNISEIISNAATHRSGVVRADLGGGSTREVIFESGVSTDRSSLRMSVATIKRAQAGIGGSAGFRLGHPAHPHRSSSSAAIGGDIGYSYELLHQEGAVFGFPRHLSGGVMGDRALATQKARLVKILISGHDPSADYPQPGNPEDQGSLIKRAYQAFGDQLSIGRFEVKQTDHRPALSASGALGVAARHFKIGLLPSSVSGQARLGSIRYQDLSGPLKVIKNTDLTTFKGAIGTVLASLNGLIDISVGDDSAAESTLGRSEAPTPAPTTPEGFNETSQLAAGSIGSASVDLFRRGETNATTRIMHDDKELGTSFATKTFANVGNFINGVASNFDNYARDKAQKYFPARYAANSQQAVETEKRVMGEYVGQVRSERDMTSTSQQYWEWGKHVESSNHLEGDAELSSDLGDKQTAQLARQEMELIHEDSAYREARFLISINARSSSEISGSNGPLGVSHSVENRATEQSIRFT